LERLEKPGLESGWNPAGIRLATFLRAVNARRSPGGRIVGRALPGAPLRRTLVAGASNAARPAVEVRRHQGSAMRLGPCDCSL
jgi:hypothetical protein